MPRSLNIKPLSDRVVIEPADIERKTSAGIVLPDNIGGKPQEGFVVAVGTGTKDEPMPVQIGDKVLYNKYGGTEFKQEGVTYLIMRVSEIYAIV